MKSTTSPIELAFTVNGTSLVFKEFVYISINAPDVTEFVVSLRRAAEEAKIIVKPLVASPESEYCHVAGYVRLIPAAGLL
jgi:hypothetical protein